MGFILYVLGATQLAIGVLILLGGWLAGESLNTPDNIMGGPAGLLFVGVLGGAFTMTLTGLITIAVGSIHNGVRRLERRLQATTTNHLDPAF